MQSEYEWGHYYGRGAAEIATPDDLRRTIDNMSSWGWSEEMKAGFRDAIREHLGEPEPENRPWWRLW